MRVIFKNALKSLVVAMLVHAHNDFNKSRIRKKNLG